MAEKLKHCLLLFLVIGIQEKCHGARLSENVLALKKGQPHRRVSRQARPLIDAGVEGIGDPPIVGSKTNRLLSNVLKNSEEIMSGQPLVPNTITNYNSIRNNAAGPNSEQSMVTLSTQSQGNLVTGGASIRDPTGGMNVGGVIGSPNPAETIVEQSTQISVIGSTGQDMRVTGANGGIPRGATDALPTSGETFVADRFGGNGGSLSAPGALGGGQSLVSSGLGEMPGVGNGGISPGGQLAGTGDLPPGGNPTGGLPPGSNPPGGSGGPLASLPPPPPPNNALNTGPASNTGSNSNGVNGLTNANGGFGTNTGIGLNTVTVVNLGDKDGKNPYRDSINININPGVGVNEEGKIVSSQASVEASSLIGLGVKAAASALSYNAPDPHESSIAHDLKKITHILTHDKLKEFDELNAKKAHLIDAIEEETEKISSHHVDPHAKKPHFEDLQHKENHLREQIKKESEKVDSHYVDPHHIESHQNDFIHPYQMYPHGDDILHKKGHQMESIKGNMHHIDPFQASPHHAVHYDPYAHGPRDAYNPYFYDPLEDFYDRRYSRIEDQIPQLQEIDRLTRLLDSLRDLDPYQSHYKREVYPLYVQKKDEECA